MLARRSAEIRSSQPLERFLAVLAVTENPGLAATGPHGDATHDKPAPARIPGLRKEPT